MRLGQRFANVIIDISHEKVDRTFQYRIPEELRNRLKVGQQVYIPFGKGNKRRTGYVVGLTDQAEYEESRLKEILGAVPGSIPAQSQLIGLAWWMKERYGSTMNQALKTVLPVKQKVKEAPKRRIRALVDQKQLRELAEEAERKHHRARLRLLLALIPMGQVPYREAMHKLELTASVLKPLEEKKIIAVEVVERYRNPLDGMQAMMGGNGGRGECQIPWSLPPALNPGQSQIVSSFTADYDQGLRRTYLLYGVTGSGKTEVYMELMAHVLSQGMQVILLIPEISLTWQTVMRFYSRFGGRVSVLNSRMSAGERYDQYERARTGDIDIIIGPRSALFAPFSRLGLIIIDEEHENAYKSELAPRYDAREVAGKRADMSGASLLLGSATPSLESYYRALKGEYGLFVLKERAKASACLPQAEVVDLRKELREGNRSIFSRRLASLIEDRLEKREQIMLFINRRGYANFISCRSCGEAVKCPHCDVTLTLHKNGTMMCHYCGYTVSRPVKCPCCGSPYIAPFGTGTQKIEELAKERFPGARVLRMDMDTTSKKGGHEEILYAFSRGEADILIGTQMIVKGHDFPRVTLVGALAADLSLYAPDYRCGEETFALLTQAAGRAGRGSKKGNVVIQTYQPDHYSIRLAAAQDYEGFYEQEMAYRRLLRYPPVEGLLSIQLNSSEEECLQESAGQLYEAVCGWAKRMEAGGHLRSGSLQVIGPANAPVYKVNDIYRKILYIKHENYDILIQIRKMAEKGLEELERSGRLTAQYDLT